MANPFKTGYVEPKNEKSPFLNFKDEGNYVFRILTPKTEVLTYYKGYIDNPAEGEKKVWTAPDNGDLKKFKPTHLGYKLVWAMVVFNHDEQQVQVWEVSQQSIKSTLFAIANGKLKNDWTKFDIQVTRTGQKTETEYTVLPGDSEELSDEAKEIIAKTDVDLSQMEKGEYPFPKKDDNKESSTGAVEALNKGVTQQMPTKKLPEIDADDLNVQMPW